MFSTGQISIVNCTGGWFNKINNYRVGEVAYFVFVVRDKFGNNIGASTKDLVLQIAQNNLIITPSSYKVVPFSSGSAQLVSFTLIISGYFSLKIGDKTTNTFSISYPFTFVAGTSFF